MSISPTLVFCLLLACAVTCGEGCFAINPCGQNLTTPPLDTLISYRIVTTSWTNNLTMVCPRSDSVNWEISFVDSMNNLLKGTYCSNTIQFDTPVVCTSNNGSLLSFLDLTSIFNTSGILDINFTSPTFTANIPFKYAPTGIFSTLTTIPLSSIVSNDRPLKWFVYQKNQINEAQIYFNGVIIVANQSFVADGYSFSSDNTVCVGSTVGEKTFVYYLSILTPSPSSVGEYTIIAAGGLYTNIVSIVLDSSYINPTSATSTATSTASDTITIQSSQFTQVMSVSSTFIVSNNTSSITVIATVSSSTPTTSPSSVSTDNSLTIILSAIISTGVVVIVAIVVSAVVAICLTFWKSRRNSTENRNSDRVHAVNGYVHGGSSDNAHGGKSDGGDGGDCGDRGDVRLESFSKRQHSQGPIEEETDFTKPTATPQHTSNGITNNSNDCTINSNITNSGNSTNSISDSKNNDNATNRTRINKLLPLESHSAPTMSPLVNPKTPPDQELSSRSELLTHVLDIKKKLTKMEQSQNGHYQRSETKDAERDEVAAETLEGIRELTSTIETQLVTDTTEYHPSSNTSDNTEVHSFDNTEVNNSTPSGNTKINTSGNTEVHSSDNTEVHNSTPSGDTDVHNSSNTEVCPSSNTEVNLSGISTSSLSSEHVNDDVTNETVSETNTDSLNNLNDS